MQGSLTTTQPCITFKPSQIEERGYFLPSFAEQTFGPQKIFLRKPAYSLGL